MGVLYSIYVKDNTPYAKPLFYKNVDIDDKAFPDERDRLQEAKKAILKFNPDIKPFLVCIVPHGDLKNPPTAEERI